MTHQRYKLSIFISLLSSLSIVFAQENITYYIEGNNLLDDQFYIECITLSNQNNFKNLSEVVGNRASEFGLFSSKIINFKSDTLNSNNIKFELNVDEGPQTFIRNIQIDTTAFQDSLGVSSQFDFLNGEVFIQQEIEERIVSAIQLLEDNGFPFVNFFIKSVTFNVDDQGTSVADIYIGVRDGGISRIDKVEIIGNTKTKKNVILNAAGLRAGEIYSQSRIENIPLILNKLRFFKSVKVPQYFINSKDEGILKIEIEEKNTNTFDGILGYVPSQTDGESGYFTGFVNISLRNLFGTGRGLAFNWKQENSQTQELSIKYLEPWFFNLPFNINVNFFQRKQDSTYVKRSFGGDLEYIATDYISASFIFESESIIPSFNQSSTKIINSSSFNTGLQLFLDYRDDIYSPQKGSYFKSTYKYRLKSINDEEFIDSEIEYHNYELDFGLYYSLFQSQVLAFDIHAKEIIGDYFDISDYFQFGGTNSLRGYRENQFLGNRIVWSNLEYRFLLSQASYLFTFFDAGYYLIDNNENEINDFKNGYGLGISLDTLLGILKVSYAIGEGTSISNGLIHFGLVNDF